MTVLDSSNSIRFPEPLRHADYARDGYTCQYCKYHDKTKSGRGLTIDHIKALEKGGAALDPKNHITACLACNSTKQHFSAAAFAALQAGKRPPPGGLPPPDMKAIREQAAKPIDLAEGKKLAEAAKAVREATGGVVAQRAAGTAAIAEHRGQLTVPGTEGTGKEGPAEKPEGPGIRHGHNGQFLPGGA